MADEPTPVTDVSGVRRPANTAGVTGSIYGALTPQAIKAAKRKKNTVAVSQDGRTLTVRPKGRAYTPYRQPEDQGQTSQLRLSADRLVERQEAQDEREAFLRASYSSRFVSQADRYERSIIDEAKRTPVSPSMADRYQDKLDYQRQTLSDDEVARYSADGIEAMNEYERARAENRETSAGRGSATIYNGTVVQSDTWADARIKQDNDPATPPTTALGPGASLESRAEWIATSHPELFSVAADILGTSVRPAADIAKLTNLTLATDAADQIMTTPNPARQKQILAAQGTAEQQALTLAVLEAKVKENQAQAAADAVGSPNPIIDFFGPAASWLMDTGLPVLGDISMAPTRAIMSLTNVVTNDYDREYFDGGVDWHDAWRDAWNQTRPGTWRKEDVEYLQGKYGTSQVNLVLEAHQLARLGEDDPVGTLYELHKDNPEALVILDAVFFSREVTPEISDMYQEIMSYDSGNFAAELLNRAGTSYEYGLFGEETRSDNWQKAGYGQFRDAINIFTWVLLDPFLVGGKIAKTVKYARLGLQNLEPGKVEKVFQKASVRGYWDNLGARIQAAQALPSGTERRAAMRRIARQEKRWFPPDVIDDLAKAGVKDADSALVWFREIDNVNRVMMGQPARRNWAQYVPHQGIAGRVMGQKTFSTWLRALDPTAKVTERASAGTGGLSKSKKSLTDILKEAEEAVDSRTGQQSILNGRYYDELTDEEASSLISKVAIDEEGGEILGLWLTNVTGSRTVSSRVLGKLRERKPNSKLGKLLERYAFSRRRSPQNIIDALSRAGAVVPDMRQGIKVIDGSDSQKIYQQLRIAGFPRWWAIEMSELWKTANPGQRRTMVQGIARTQAYALGAHLINPEDGVEEIVAKVTGARVGESYAANMIPGSAAKKKQILDGLRASNVALREADEPLDALDEDEVIARLNAIYGEDVVNDARQLQALIDDMNENLADEDVRGIINGYEDTLRLADDDNALDKAIDDLIENDTNSQYVTPSGEDGVYLPVLEALARFSIPGSKETVKPPLNWRKAGNGWTGTGDGYKVTITRNADGGYVVTKADGTVLDTAPTLKAAKQLGEIDSGLAPRRGGGGVSPRVQKMLLRGYLPQRWAKQYADETGESTSWGEEQAALFLGVQSTDEVGSFDWRALAEDYTTFGKSKEKWIEIPWMKDLRTNIARQLVDEPLESGRNDYDALTGRLAQQSDEIDRLKGLGTKSLDELKEESAAAKGVLTDEELEEQAVVLWNAWLGEQAAKSPSEGLDGQQAAVFMGQTTDRVNFPSLTALEPYMTHRNFLAALLGNNRGVQAMTDAWVFLTLAGPRFALRNAFEDWIFWTLTAGGFKGPGGIRSGRRASQGLRQSRSLIDAEIQAAIDEEDRLIAQVAKLEASPQTYTASQVADARKALEEARAKLGKAVDSASAEGLKTEKLGLVKTGMRKVGTLIGRRVDDETTGGQLVQALVHPYLSADEVLAANKAYAKGDRKALGALMGKAYVRERMFYLPSSLDPTYGEFGGFLPSDTLKNWVAARNGDVTVLSPADRQVLQDIDDFAQGRNGFEFLSAVVEESRNMIDGTLPAWNETSDITLVSGQLLQRTFIQAGYETVETVGRSPKAVDATWHTLSMALHGDGPKSQAAMYHLRRWMTGTEAERSAVIDDVVDAMLAADKEYNYLARFSLYNNAGAVDNVRARDLARSTLETLEGAFTTRAGGFNEDLWKATRGVNKDGLVNFKLWDDVTVDQQLALNQTFTDGTSRSYRVSKIDFQKGKYELPRTYLTFDGIPAVVPAENPGGWWKNLTDQGWNMMGRSMARMTREPMFLANYLEARQALRPFEKEWKRVYGDSWRGVADRIATEKAYQLTLSYIDNPAIRSQMAWQVRNIARFYRALEDFTRRSWRAISNDPMSVYKLAFGINLLDDIGFLERDNNGEYTFTYPLVPGIRDVVGGFIQNVLHPGFESSLPLNIGSRVTGLTPSADPEALWPTFSGIYATVPLRTLLAAAPTLDNLLGTGQTFENAAYTTEATLFGQISADSPDKLRSMMPTHVARLFDVAYSMSTPPKALDDMSEGAVANAARAAIQVHVGAGNITGDAALSDEEYNDVIELIDHTALEIAIVKLIGGFFLPASPSVNPTRTNEIARELGMYTFQQGYYDLREKFGDEEALVMWYERHPDLAPYTVSTSGDDGMTGYFTAEKETEEWLKANSDILDTYPVGVSYVAPRSENPTFNRGSYNYLVRQGLKPRKTVGNYLRDVAISEGQIAYRTERQYWQNRRNEIRLNTSISDAARQEKLKETEARERDSIRILYENYPGLKYKISGRDNDGMDPKTAARSIEGAMRMYLPRATDPEERRRLNYLLVYFDNYNEALSYVGAGLPSDPRYQAVMDDLRPRWKAMSLKVINDFPEDDQVRSIAYLLTSALGWTLEED